MVLGSFRCISLVDDLTAFIIGIGGFTKFYIGAVSLMIFHEKLNDACSFTQEDRQDASSIRVECSGMPYVAFTGQAFYTSHHPERCHPGRFVDV